MMTRGFRPFKVGLGTDVSGGFSPSILTAVQHASIASKVVAMHHPPPPAPSSSSEAVIFASHQLSIATLLYLATQGGADVCDISSLTGSLEPGKAFDALIASVRSDAGNPGVWGVDWDIKLGVRAASEVTKELLVEMLERFLFCGDDRNIRKVYVQGRLIGGKEFGA